MPAEANKCWRRNTSIQRIPNNVCRYSIPTKVMPSSALGSIRCT